ncbi:MAG: RNA-guided pseudouridylation complex pseudouridine synthase subunit Cbf5 [Candidatus Aenigmarchaeota archaeon]|nr:RNA-guided pseudouridylation complex pseudouridine synthase subunit Cbf5 [Candidatus Aenigmarchaeota archaeon]
MTGVLPVALDNATKAMSVLLGLDKEYIGVMHLHKQISEEILREEVKKFVGKIVQVPPVRSAVARKPREKNIYFFDILEIEGKDVLFKVGCQAGVYVRKLVSDLGLRIGGAHLTELRRTKAGNFTEDQAHSLTEIKDAYEFWKEGRENFLKEILIPVEYAVLHLKRVFVKDSAVDSICHGAPVFCSGLTRIQEGIEKNEIVAVYTLKEELVALGKAVLSSKEMFERKKGIAIKTDKVFMRPGIYPSFKT